MNKMKRKNKKKLLRENKIRKASFHKEEISLKLSKKSMMFNKLKTQILRNYRQRKWKKNVVEGENTEEKEEDRIPQQDHEPLLLGQDT
jgi:transposase